VWTIAEKQTKKNLLSRFRQSAPKYISSTFIDIFIIIIIIIFI